MMYHSSLKGKNSETEKIEYVEVPNKIFFHDMTENDIPDAFRTCDCVYSEPSSRYGFSIFNERAGMVVKDDWKTYVKNIDRTIMVLNVPAFIICGQEFLKYMPNVADVRDVVLNTNNKKLCDCKVAIFNTVSPDLKTSSEIISYIAANYKKVLDFSCGYGEHMMNFQDFVATDINRDCLAYLSKKWREKNDYQN